MPQLCAVPRRPILLENSSFVIVKLALFGKDSSELMSSGDNGCELVSADWDIKTISIAK